MLVRERMRVHPITLLFLGMGLLLGCGASPTPVGHSPEELVAWAFSVAVSRPNIRSLDEALEPGEPPTGVEPRRFIVWGEPPAAGAPFVRDEVVHGVWVEVQDRFYTADEATYRRYRPHCGDGYLTCVRLAILKFSENEAVIQIDTFIAPLAGRGSRLTLRWEGDDWKVVNIEVVWIS